MNPVISAQLRDFAVKNSIASEHTDRQFEIYSIFSVLNGLLGESVEACDVHLTGDEFGVDGVAIIIQGDLVRNRTEVEEKLENIKNPNIEFIFFQSKSGSKFEYGDISKFYDAVEGFFNGDLAGESEDIDDLREAMNAIYEKGVGKRNPKISCYYITTGNYDEPQRIERLRNSFRSTLQDLNIFDTSLKVEMVGAKELQQWYRTATTSVEVEIDFARNVVMPSNGHVEEAYIGYIDARNLLKLFTSRDEDGAVVGINRAVFFDNIRDYDALSKINIGIKNGVLNDGGGEFVFRNNGITVVSKNIDRTGDRFKLEDFQIVNGCQTSNIIFDLVYGGKDNERDFREDLETAIQVPFRLIGSKDDDFVSSIIIGTNRQNSVRDEQFWALRPFMKSFEEYCRSLDQEEVIYFERRDNQYRNTEVERTRVMQPSVLMKSVAAGLLFQPQRAARDYRGILSEFADKIFLDDHDVRIYHSIAYLYYRLEFLWRNQKLPNAYKTFRYYFLAGVGLRVSRGNSVFSMKKGKIAEFASQVISIAKDEEQLRAIAEEIFHLIRERLDAHGTQTQERIRDAIRQESFAITFREKVLADVGV